MRRITFACALMMLCAGSTSAQNNLVDINTAKVITDALALIEGSVDGLEAAAIHNLPANTTLSNGMSIPSTTLIGMVPMCKDPGSTLSFCLFGTDGLAFAATGNGGPRLIGHATNSLSTATLASNDNDMKVKTDLSGVLINRPFANPEDTVTHAPVAITDGSSTSVLAAAGSGVRNYVTDIECANSSATNVTVDIRDGTAGAVLWTISCPAGGGNNKSFAMPLRGSANTAVAADPSAAASTVTISINGFKSKL